MLESDVRVAISDAVRNSVSFDDALTAIKRLPSTVGQHWQMILRYGRCADAGVVEYGTGFSTFAWLESGANVLSVDVEKPLWIDRLVELSCGRLCFVQASSLEIEPRRCGVLYIDTLHIYQQLFNELTRHACLCEKYIVMHDTEAFGFPSSVLLSEYSKGDRGLIAAVDDFLHTDDSWYIVERFSHQFGMTVLGRKPK